MDIVDGRHARAARALGWLVATIAAVSCAPEASDPDGASTIAGPDATTTGDSTAPEAPDPTGESPSNPSAPATTDGDATSSSGDDTSSGEAPGIPGCDAVAKGGYNDCYVDGEFDTVACGWMGTSESVGFPTCITAALVDDGSVCAIKGCVDRCDCFATPPTGTATVECMEGVVAEDKACVLYCGGGEVCPDGMLCSYQICVWP